MPFESARELARRIREGEVTALEVVEAHLAQIERHNPRINAVVTLDAKGARQRALEADEATARGENWGPLHGVPFTAKDTYQSEGLATTSIAMSFATHTPDKDAVLVKRLKDTGAILLGKTNLPTASYDWQTNSAKLGCCNNPYDINRTPGGSSGGAAAALAAGMTPIEIGSDVAGSIRMPAHFCGVAGLRPTEGTLNLEGHGVIPGTPNTIQNLAVAGPMARDVADLELLFDVLLGDDEHQLLRADTKPLSKRKLAWTQSIGAVWPSASIVEAMTDLEGALSKAGAEVEPDTPMTGWDAAQEVWGTLQGHELIQAYPALIRMWPFRWLLRTGIVGWHFGVSQFSRTLARGYTSSAEAYAAALEQREAIMQSWDRWIADYDAWLCPAAPLTAFPHRGTGTPLRIDERIESYSGALSLYGCPIATLGCPVAVVRIGQDEDGMPIGVQVVGARGADRTVLRIARQVEELCGGFVAPALTGD